MGIPPDRCTSWGTEALELVAEIECTEDQAREEVTLRYLYDGDCRPLLDWALGGHIPSTKIMRIVAGMFDREYRCGDAADVRYEFRIDEVRTPGRPRGGDGVGSLGSRLARSMHEHGAKKLAKGIDPGRHFWLALTNALVQGNSRWIWRQDNAQASFPLKAMVQKHTQGRSGNPELSMRDKLLAQLVKERIDKGEPYEFAVDKVFEQIEETRPGDGPRGSGSRDLIKKRTIRDAYDHSVRWRR
jgi:hypothetical protein